MMHWPLCPSSVDDVRSTLDNAWRGMERLLDEGTCRSIGVSNFSIQDLIGLMENCSVVPHVSPNNGFDLPLISRWLSLSIGKSVRVPSLSESKRTESILQGKQDWIPGLYTHNLAATTRPFSMFSWVKQKQMDVTELLFKGYCPLANGMILKEPPVVKVAQSAGRSPAQVLIRWSIQNGVVTIPKSIKKERIQENCQVREMLLEFCVRVLCNKWRRWSFFRCLTLNWVHTKWQS